MKPEDKEYIEELQNNTSSPRITVVIDGKCVYITTLTEWLQNNQIEANFGIAKKLEIIGNIVRYGSYKVQSRHYLIRDTKSDQIVSEYYIKIGHREYPVASLKQASQHWTKAQLSFVRQYGHVDGMSNITPMVYDKNHNHIGYISLNGRVWQGKPEDWNPDTVLLYDNRA